MSYSLSTPIDVIAGDPRGREILIRDVPNVVYNPHYGMSALESLMDVENLSGAGVPQPQLARAEADLAALSAAEQPVAGSDSSYGRPPPIFTTSFTCADGNTPVQNAVCGNPQLASLDVQMGSLFQRHLGEDSIFQRDQVLASQQGWIIGLAGACSITPGAGPAAAAVPCLASAYQARITALANWPAPQTLPGLATGAITNYVNYKLLDARQPAACAALAAQAAGALSKDGSIDPNRLAGAHEIAGSHGNPSGAAQGGNVSVDLYRADLYGGYEIRARSVSISGAAPVLGPTSIGDYVQSLPNGGGRFVSFASQTGDYGDIDVFTLNGQVLALLTDTMGYNSPAPPGEAAVAGLYTLSQNSAAPACMFETYLMPPPLSMGVFSQAPSLSAFLALVDAIHGEPSADLAPSDRQDAAYFAQSTRWMMFNMPLVVTAQAKAGNWTGWLRARHDKVLDALFAWSQKSPANQAMFARLFILLRPAAMDLSAIYVQQEGLTAGNAGQATAIAMMELLYQSTTNFDPGLGGGPADPADAAAYQPRYPILANPQS